MKDSIKDYLKGVPCLFEHSVPGGVYGKKGIPDIIVCYKGLYIGIEAKTYEGEFSDWQKARRTQIMAAGGIVIFARSVEDVRDVIESL